jgi:ATP-dependent Clp protease adaptor protein ClpS
MTKTEEEIKDKEEIQETNKLILFNDDVNSFQTVIRLLCEVLRIGGIQAEQIAILVDAKKKYCIKSGSYDELIPIYHKLSDGGLMCEIE